jgi:hypothetical protein
MTDFREKESQTRSDPKRDTIIGEAGTFRRVHYTKVQVEILHGQDLDYVHFTLG